MGHGTNLPVYEQTHTHTVEVGKKGEYGERREKICRF